MRPTLLFLLAIAGAPASDGAAADPAVALPREFRFVAEAEDVAGLTVRLRATPIFADLPLPTEANPVLDALATAGVRRAAFAAGFAPHRGWVLAASADDRDACAEAFAVVAERLGGGATAVRIGPFAGLCDGPETVERLRKLPLTGRDAAPPPGVIAARTRCAGADVRFHLDLSGTRLFRLGVARLHDAGHALLAAHVASVAASADAAWGRLDAGSRTALTLEASVPPLPEARRFAAPDAPAASRPSASTLELPPGWLARLSLTRDLAAFWERRDVFVPDSGRAALAEFRNNLSTLLGGLAPEDLFAGLGTGFDLFVGPSPALEPPPRGRLPTLALVADAPDPALQLELALGFQTAVGVINAQRAMDGAPRLLLETDVYRGVRRLSARHLPELVGAPDDDRLQLAPVLACVGGRVVLATHPEAAQALIDRALDGPATPRATGDALHLRGAPIAEALRLARPFLAARAAVTQEGGAAPDAEIARAAALIERIRGVDVHFAVGAGRARLTAEIDAPALLEPPGTAPR